MIKWQAWESRISFIEARQLEFAPNVLELREEMHKLATESIKEVHDTRFAALENVFAQKLNAAMTDLDARERKEKKLNIIVKGLNCEPGGATVSTRTLLKEKFKVEESIREITPLQSPGVVAVTLKPSSTF